MPRITVPCLLLACAVSLCSSAAVFQENGLPLMWAQTVAQLTDLPVENDILKINPWTLLQRMNLYKLLIISTDPYMGSMGPNTTESPFWGLPMQLGWMLSSGRLADPSGATTCGLQTGDTSCISPQSWWGCVNSFATVMSVLSANHQGFFGEVQIQMVVPEGETIFCTTYADCTTRYQDAMSKWDVFFKALKIANESPLSDIEKKDSLLGLYWAAQMSSTSASAVCKTRLSHYSSKEVSFTESWENSAEYVAAAHFQSNLEKASLFIAPLPSRILLEDDEAPNITDMSEEENKTLETFSWMSVANKALGGSVVRMWQAAMCSVTTRQKGCELLEQLLLSPNFAFENFMPILIEMTTKC